MSDELDATDEPAIPAIRDKPGKPSASLADVAETKKYVKAFKTKPIH